MNNAYLSIAATRGYVRYAKRCAATDVGSKFVYEDFPNMPDAISGHIEWDPVILTGNIFEIKYEGKVVFSKAFNVKLFDRYSDNIRVQLD